MSASAARRFACDFERYVGDGPDGMEIEIYVGIPDFCQSCGMHRFSGDVFDHFSVFHRLRVGKYVSICWQRSRPRAA